MCHTFWSLANTRDFLVCCIFFLGLFGLFGALLLSHVALKTHISKCWLTDLFSWVADNANWHSTYDAPLFCADVIELPCIQSHKSWNLYIIRENDSWIRLDGQLIDQMLGNHYLHRSLLRIDDLKHCCQFLNKKTKRYSSQWVNVSFTCVRSNAKSQVGFLGQSYAI